MRSSGTRRRRRLATVGLVAGAAYVVLSLLVATGRLDGLDATARQWFRPDNVWGPLQLRVDVVVELLKPPHSLPALVVVGALAAAVRRSWRPVLMVARLVSLTVICVLLTKLLVSRPDTHGDVATLGGSYPSGHTTVLLVALGGILLILVARPPWWSWLLVAAVDAAMGASLLIQAAHWFTDVVGGMLLGTSLLAAATLWDTAIARRAARDAAAPAREPPPGVPPAAGEEPAATS